MHGIKQAVNGITPKLKALQNNEIFSFSTYVVMRQVMINLDELIIPIWHRPSGCV